MQNEALEEAPSLNKFSQMKTVIKRLKLTMISDVLSADQSLSTTYILRLKFSKKIGTLIDTLNAKTPSQTFCFPFDLSLRVSHTLFTEKDYNAETDPTENELVRIDWSMKFKDEKFDPRQKLSVFLQFKESLKEEYKTLKFTPFAYLVKDSLTHEASFNDRIYP